VLGGSFVFGVGATHDRHTLVSKLNLLTEYSFLNLGIRAGNSIQELIASVPFLEDAQCVIVCSGINNVAANLQSTGMNEVFGPLYAEEVFNALREYSAYELAGRVRHPLRSVRFRALVTELIRRILARCSPFRRNESANVGSAVHLPDLGSGELREALVRALELQRRDITVIKKSLPGSCRLIFAAQPFAGGAAKECTWEERRLFDITDRLQNVSWQVLKSHLTELWPAYVVELQKICASIRIPFTNLNAIKLSGWCYVDRAHMVDNGYMQVAQWIGAELEQERASPRDVEP
jgi:hypothetical protein